jgi:hypothetical protein
MLILALQTYDSDQDRLFSIRVKPKKEEPKKKEPKKKEPSLSKYPKNIWYSIENSLASYQDTTPLSKSGGLYSDKELIEFDKTAKELEKNERWKLPFSKLSSLEKKTIKVILESEALSLDPQDKKEKLIHDRITKIFPKLPSS